MTKYFYLFGIVLLSCQPKENLRFTKEINKILSREKGIFAVAYRNLKTGETLLINEHELFHAASTMKTPVMMEVFKQAEKGNFLINDSIMLKNEFKSIVDGSVFSLSPADDSEQESYNHLGKKRTIDALVYDMIIVSSNLATNLIIELVDAKLVTASMREIGANDIQVLRGVEDSKAFEKGMNNVTSAYDLMILFEKIAKGELVSKKSSSKMEEILLDQKFNEIIPALLPSDVKVAHKTGNIAGVRHDSGIVILPNGDKYVLVLLSKQLENEETGIKAMADVSKKIFDHVTAK
jgi:beta-lactamase class A